MMSINEVKSPPNMLSQLVRKQYIYKLKGHSRFLYSLIFIQLISALLSLGMRGGMSSSSDFIRIVVNTYSGDFLLVFSGLWMIVVTATLGSQLYRSMDFSVVNNRLASQLSSILLVVTYAVFAGITSTLMTVIHRLVIALTLKEDEFLLRGLNILPQDLLLGIVVGLLYLILLAATTYLIQNLSQLSRGLGIMMWIFFFAFAIGTFIIFGFPVGFILSFYTAEASLGIFILKVLSSALLFFGLSVLISRRMEVRR